MIRVLVQVVTGVFSSLSNTGQENEQMGKRRELDDYPPVMDSADVAEMLNIPDIKSVQQMAREGRIPAYRLPGERTFRFFRDEILKWSKSQPLGGSETQTDR